MITTKNNFKGYLRKHYPNINAYPVYGLPMYILDTPLNDIDNYTYNVQPLPNGKHVAFIDVSPAAATVLLTQLREHGVPSNGHSPERIEAPTTFSCFEAWLERHGIRAINRTFCNNMSPQECLHSDCIVSCSAPQKKGVWYMYELNESEDDGKRFVNIPHITIDDTLIVLIKASASRYKSKRQRFIEKFQLMQPIYEKLIAACAVADQMDVTLDPGASVQWEEARKLCTQYMNIQFETEGNVDVNEMKEAFRNGTIGLYVRDVSRMHIEDSETF